LERSPTEEPPWLLAEHVPDPEGWCRSHIAHLERHPCSIRRLAELAGGREQLR
jgi:hypothetical protein